MRMSPRKVEIVSRKTVKPSSPTPQCLKTFKLSGWDERPPPIYGVLIFFYQADTNTINNNTNNDRIVSRFTEKSQRLQQALSDALTRYYPLAGRLKDAFTAIECNDEGAHFVEARIDCLLPNLLDQADAKLLYHFIPTLTDPMLPSNCTLAVQLTLFNCGGLAISVCTSHKIADATSLYSFVQCWTAMNRECYDKVVAPKFLEPHSSPPTYLLDLPFAPPRPKKYTSGRFVFHASKIASLKANISAAATLKYQYLTNLDAVVALILKCVISAASRSLSGYSGPTVLYYMVNMRKRVIPILPNNTVGNIFWMAPVVLGENDLELHDMAGKIRESLIDIYDAKASKIRAKSELLKTIEGVIPYLCTSLCHLPLYDADFGWGKPLWVINPTHDENFISLLPTKDGQGIEAWISLDEKVMAKFERDDELLAFASPNPSAMANRCRM